jgi:hypothetical protein
MVKPVDFATLRKLLAEGVAEAGGGSCDGLHSVDRMMA